MKLMFLALVAVAAVTRPAFAADRWEIRSDDDVFTNNELQPGIAQEGHDLQTEAEVADADWYKVIGQQERSYEARVFGGGIAWRYPACLTCATLDRVAGDGSLLTAGDNDLGGGPGSQSVRWLGGAAGQFLRVLPGKDGTGGNATEQYDIVVLDTTLYLPRFNNTGSQRTVLILQNARDRAVEGRIYFHDDAGDSLLAHDFTVGAHASLVLNTGALAPLVGRSGSAVISHTGGVGAFTGKGVSLEPSTGFTFDTAITTAPR
jgi:hypothetical protein